MSGFILKRREPVSAPRPILRNSFFVYFNEQQRSDLAINTVEKLEGLIKHCLERCDRQSIVITFDCFGDEKYMDIVKVLDYSQHDVIMARRRGYKVKLIAV